MKFILRVVLLQCATSVGGVSDYNAISTCIATAEGDNLLVGYGDRTHALTPTITFVPTIVYNDVKLLKNSCCLIFL
jgi:hypothetical protein